MKITGRVIAGFILFMSLAGSGYSAVVYTRVSQDSISIGDRVELTVAIVTPNSAVITPPAADDAIGLFTVKGWDTHTAVRAKSDSTTYRFILALYTPEPCSIPALSFIIKTADSAADTVQSQTIPLRYVPLVTSDTAQIRDIKPPLMAGTPSLWWLWTLIIIAAAAVVWFYGRTLWRRALKTAAVPPPIPPYDEAIQALARLQGRQYLMKGMIREYVFELSEILKRYIGRRFDVNAAEHTTEELLEWLPQAPFEKALKKTMEWFFSTTHPVKFARLIPDSDTVVTLYETAVDFVEKTRPLPQENVAETTAKPGAGNAV